MFKFIVAFSSYSLLVYCRRLFFIFPEETKNIFNYSKTEYGHIVTIFSICYTFSKLLLGSLNDIFTPIKLLCLSMFGVGISLCGIFYTSSVLGLYFWIPLTSLFQGGAWLSIVKFIKENYDDKYFPILFTIMGCTNNFSGIITPILSFTTWKELNLFYGVFMIIFSICTYFILRNSRSTQKLNGNKKIKSKVYTELITSPVIWKIAIFLFISIELRALFEMWSPIYFSEYKNGTSKLRRSMTFFEIGGAVGGIFAGLLVQYLQKYFDKDDVRWHTGCMFTGISFIFSNSFFTSKDNHDINGFISGAGIYACITIFGMISADSAPYHICAAASACVSFISNLAPIFVGSPLAAFIENYGFIVIPTFLQFQTVIFVILIFITKNIPLHTSITEKEE